MLLERLSKQLNCFYVTTLTTIQVSAVCDMRTYNKWLDGKHRTMQWWLCTYVCVISFQCSRRVTSMPAAAAAPGSSVCLAALSFFLLFYSVWNSIIWHWSELFREEKKEKKKKRRRRRRKPRGKEKSLSLLYETTRVTFRASYQDSLGHEQGDKTWRKGKENENWLYVRSLYMYFNKSLARLVIPGNQATSRKFLCQINRFCFNWFRLRWKGNPIGLNSSLVEKKPGISRMCVKCFSTRANKGHGRPCMHACSVHSEFKPYILLYAWSIYERRKKHKHMNVFFSGRVFVRTYYNAYVT